MLEIRDLRVHIDGHEIVHIDELDLPRGTRLGLVGESGSGKTMTAKAIAGLLPAVAKASGTVRFDGRNLVGLDDGEFSKIRGKRIGFIFQDPARSLNPVMRVGRQVSEAIRLHTDIKGRAVTDKVVELLEAGASAGSRCAPSPVPAPALGRAAATGDDRRRDRGRPRASDRRRTDDSTGRDGPARDPPTPHLADRAARDERLVRQPRPRRGSVRVRPSGGGLRWAGRRDPGASTTSSSARGTGTPRRCSPRARGCRRTTTLDPSSDGGCRRSTGPSRRSGASPADVVSATVARTRRPRAPRSQRW